MLIKQFTDLRNPQIWDLSENEDIIITRKGRSEQRVLINFKLYEAMKKALLKLQQNKSIVKDSDELNLSPYLQDFKDILENDIFEEVTEKYFENLAREHKNK